MYSTYIFFFTVYVIFKITYIKRYRKIFYEKVSSFLSSDKKKYAKNSTLALDAEKTIQQTRSEHKSALHLFTNYDSAKKEWPNKS